MLTPSAFSLHSSPSENPDRPSLEAVSVFDFSWPGQTLAKKPGQTHEFYLLHSKYAAVIMMYRVEILRP